MKVRFYLRIAAALAADIESGRLLRGQQLPTHRGSLVAAFTQGMAVGALIKGLPIAIGRYTGGEFGWFSAFAVL